MRLSKSAASGSQVSSRSRIKTTLFLLAGLMALSWPRFASAQVAVSNVLAPVPPGAAPGGVMFLSATVKPRGLRPATVSFYLGEASTHGPDDILLATSTVRPLSLLLAPQSLQLTAPIGPLVPPGFYFVLACTGNQCAATAATIEIIGQGLSPVDQTPGTTSPTPPAQEYFPENPGDGFTVTNPFPCPFSTHGQWPSSCVGLLTTVITVPNRDGVDGLFYCPANRPYPFQVAIGDDPVWEDKTTPPPYGARTNAVSFTKYKIGFAGHAFSYAGFGPGTTPPNRGYVSFRFFGSSITTVSGQAFFVCSDKPTTGAQP